MWLPPVGAAAWPNSRENIASVCLEGEGTEQNTCASAATDARNSVTEDALRNKPGSFLHVRTRGSPDLERAQRRARGDVAGAPNSDTRRLTEDAQASWGERASFARLETSSGEFREALGAAELGRDVIRRDAPAAKAKEGT